MKHRIAAWAGIGFLVACCWVFYTFVVPPETLVENLRNPAVQAFAFISCPAVWAGRHFPLHFWWVPFINAFTYSMIGWLTEMLRRRQGLGLAI